MSEPEYLTPKEYARSLGVCLRTVRTWIKSGKVPGMVRVGGRIRIVKANPPLRAAKA